MDRPGRDSTVIVKCPSCGTRYRHDPSVTAACGRCSRCDVQVPLVAAGRGYVMRLAHSVNAEPMMATAGHGPGMGIASALPRSDAERLTEVVTGEMRTPNRAVDAVGDDEANEAQAGRPLDLLLDDSESVGQARSKRNPLRETLLTILLASLGVMTAYYISQEQGLEPTTWMAVGGGAGLFFSWICIRWMRRSH